MSSAAVVLAAGAGDRFGADRGHKLLAPLDGRPVVSWAVGAAVEACSLGAFDEVIVVWGAVDLAVALGGMPVRLIEHRGWGGGQATSLHAGIRAAETAGHDAVVIGLGDQPAAGTDAWQAVALAADGPIVVADYGGRLAPPVRLDRAVWPLLPKDGDVGARAIFDTSPQLVHHVPVDGDPADIDTVEDLQRWT